MALSALQSSLKEKDGNLRAQQRHQHASLLLCSERSTQQSSSPWRTYLLHKVDCVWLRTILPNVPLIPSLLLLLPIRPPSPSSPSLSLVLVLTSSWKQQNCLASLRLGVALLRGSEGLGVNATLCQADGTHSSCRHTLTPKQRLTNSPRFDLMFLFH